MDLVYSMKKEYFLVEVIPPRTEDAEPHLKVRPSDAENDWRDKVLYPSALRLTVEFK
jgi:hypothetical protein